MNNWGKNVSTGYCIWLNCHFKNQNASVISQSVHHWQMLIQAFLYHQPNPRAPLRTPPEKPNRQTKNRKKTTQVAQHSTLDDIYSTNTDERPWLKT